LSEDYFSRVFRKETGYGYKEFLIRQKIEYARKLLEETDMPVTIIASKVGYGNFNQFTQIFRKYTGETPSGLRKKSENR
ncbi:MAG: helix-turn-helix domain-containing protein, partial [Eubacterium sp.]